MPIIIGTWPLSGDFGHVGLEQVATTLRSCIDLGFTDFDSAPNYGNGFIEACLGKELSRVDGVGINTKFGSRPFGGKSFAVVDLRDSFEQSLRRLAVERVDVLFLHNPRDDVPDHDAILRLFDDLKTQGKIVRSGISLAKGHSYAAGLLNQFDVIQDDANLLSMSAFERIANAPGVTFMARSPLASGILSGKIDELTTFDDGDHRASWLKGDRLRSIMKRVRAIGKVCDETLPELAYRFLAAHPSVDDIVCGVRRPEHVRALATYINAPRLNDATVGKLETLWQSDFGLIGEHAMGY